MKISEYGAFLEKAWKHRRRVLAVSKPGVGKTFTEMATARRMGMDYIPLCGPLLNPVKVSGYPVPPKEEGGDATHALFDGMARAFKATRDTVLSVSDIGNMAGETSKCFLDIVQFGRIDNRVLPDCVRIVGSSNDIGHGCDVQGLIESLKTRWHTIVNVETSVDDVVAYGLAVGWPSDLLAFLRNVPDALHDWKPSKSLSVDGANPRAWESVANWVNIGVDDAEVLAGCVGKGRAAQYCAFRGLMADLPDIDAVLMTPDTAPVPENPSARYLVAMALASRLTAANFGRAVTYLHRLPAMFEAFSVRDAMLAESNRKRDDSLPKDWKAIASSRDFTAWACSPVAKAIQEA